MTPEAWGFFSLLTGSTFGLLSESIKTRKKVEKAAKAAGIAAVKAEDAADAAAPMANGWSKGITKRLDDISEGLHIVHDEVTDVKKDVSFIFRQLLEDKKND